VANPSPFSEYRFSEPLLISIPLLPRGLKYRLHANCTLRRFGERRNGEALVHCLNAGAGSAMLMQRMSDLEKTKALGRKAQPGAAGEKTAA
jgi:hypothetical protein